MAFKPLSEDSAPNSANGSQMVSEQPDDFARRLKLPFQEPALLVRALTHRSYVNENSTAVEDNERLEFLGDAVLDFLVAAWLYSRYPEMREGELTRLRAALVDTNQLAAFARNLEFGQALRLGRGELEGGGRDRDSLLCGAFEAVVGALYLDQGIQAVKDFIHPLLTEATQDALLRQRDKDPKSRLQEWSQSGGQGIPLYRLVESTGPDHARFFKMEVSVAGVVLAEGSGPSKQVASMNAARNALAGLGIE